MSDQNVFIHLIAGGLAGTTGAILTCPLEVVKTRFQASQINSCNIYAAKSNNYQSTLPNKTSSKLNNLAKNSPSKLFCYPNIMLRNNHGATTEISFGTHLNHTFNNHNSQSTHIEYNSSSYKRFRLGRNIYFCFKSMIENEGYRSLFKGLGPNLIGVAPYRAIYFFSYANSKNYLCKKLGEERPILHVLSAFVAGFSAVTITNPIWFVKTRLQLDQSRRGSRAFEVIDKILKEKGPLGFYKGISASYFGIAESALYFVLYERLKKLSADSSNEQNLSLFTYFTSAGFSKTTASILCYPHEVARTRLRLEGNKYTGFFQTLNLIIQEEGVRGIYKGMGTHLIRQIPNTAIVMTTYELIIHYFASNEKSYLLGNDDE